MNRICEEVQYLDVFAPHAVATATTTTRTVADTAGADSVEFQIYTGALTSGKKLTVGVQTSANAGGSSPEEAEEMVFTASGSTPGLAVVSYRVRGDRDRYVGVTFQHNAGSEVDCAVLAAVRPMYRPPENSWQLVV